jgi:hypothetical protein
VCQDTGRQDITTDIITSKSQIVPDNLFLQDMNASFTEQMTNMQCAVCGLNLTTVASLQAHLLTNHCNQNDSIIQMMQVMNDKICQIATNQSSVQEDMKQLKVSMLKVVESARPVFLPPAPHHAPQACPSVPASSPSSPGVPSYAAAAGAGATGQQQSGQSAVQQSGQSTARQSGQSTVRQSGQSGSQSGLRVNSAPSKISYVMDSIGHNVKIKELEKLTKTRISKRKAYGAVRDAKQKFPNSNFTDTVPIEMRENRPDILVLQRDSVTLTDLSLEDPEMYNKQQVKVSSYNMFVAATAALASNPDCRQVILCEAIPRYDGKEKLNQYGNMMLHQAKEESSSPHQDKVTIGVHDLDCEGGVRAARYGDGRKTHVDMIHMRGSSGLVAFTRSLSLILAKAGLASYEEAKKVMRSQDVQMSNDSFQTQGRRGRKGPRQQQQQSTFQLATHNRWAGFQGNL